MNFLNKHQLKTVTEFAYFYILVESSMFFRKYHCTSLIKHRIIFLIQDTC
jgi:hypothetical protein